MCCFHYYLCCWCLRAKWIRIKKLLKTISNKSNSIRQFHMNSFDTVHWLLTRCVSTWCDQTYLTYKAQQTRSMFKHTSEVMISPTKLLLHSYLDSFWWKLYRNDAKIPWKINGCFKRILSMVPFWHRYFFRAETTAWILFMVRYSLQFLVAKFRSRISLTLVNALSTNQIRWSEQEWNKCPCLQYQMGMNELHVHNYYVLLWFWSQIMCMHACMSVHISFCSDSECSHSHCSNG